MNRFTAKNHATGETFAVPPDSLAPSDLEEAGHKKQALSKVIRAKCLDCCCGQPSEVRKCTASDCPLWPYRMGKNPFFNYKG